MKRLLNVKFPLVMLLVMLIAFGCSEKKASSPDSLKYTCPMHPEIVKEKPGVCPICKMDLEQVHQHASQIASKSLIDSIEIAESKGIKIIEPLDTIISNQERATGIIAYNTNSFRQISARVNGRIEQLYIRYNYQPVSKGQKLMEIYSPEIASAGQELLFLKNERESKLLEAAKKKLYLLGLSGAQVAAMLRNGKVDYSVAVYSPYSGFIVETKSIEPTRSSGTSKISSDNSASGMGGMSSGNSQSSAPGANQSENSGTPLLLREGQYVSAGQKLFSIVSTENVWGEFYVTAGQAKSLKSGMYVSVKHSGEDKKSTNVRVSRILPFYKEGTSYVQVRTSIPNSSNIWKVGEQVEMQLGSGSGAGKWLPKTAVLHLGGRNVVFVKTNDSFKPVSVMVKNKADDFVNVGNSLGNNVEVVENAWFVVDSESFIKPEGGNKND